MSEKKYYVVGATTPQSWESIHAILTQDGTLDDNIPNRAVECTDIKDHSPTRAVYLLDDDEAAQLSQCPDVKFIHLEQSEYRDLFPPTPDEFHSGARYSTPVKNYRDLSVGYPNPPTAADINRTGYQVLRGTSYANSWTTATSIVNSVVPNITGTGVDIDVIVGDEGCWFGHVEFANNTGNGPVDYKWANAGNPLSSTGTCDVLDLVLDGPYYIDPSWFNASPGTRLMTRWDGTVVPTETAAKNWWGDSSQRSGSFASLGTVAIPSYYTRANCNGSDTAMSAEGQHGTACAGQTYGRTFGWAYNANKWFINAYGNYGLWPVDNYFDVMKIFHQAKPVNPTHGNKDPTISSNSWGFRTTVSSTGYYYFRQGTTGAGGVAFTGTKPAFMQYLGSTGDGGRFKGEMLDNSLTVAGDELIAAGVIFVAAAGNSNQQQASSDHPNFNNYWATASGTPLASATHNEFGSLCYNTTSRRGFPQHLGKYTTGTTVVYPTINIGALDDSYTAGGLERKVNYSDMGNEIDVFAPGDGTLTSAWMAYGIQYPRYDQRTKPGSLTSYDTRFSGTSSACPTATGMIATALQYNRTWTWQDVRTWLHSLTEQSSTTFYQGPDPSTATDAQWSDLNSLQGGARRVLYNNISNPAPALTATNTVNFIILSQNNTMVSTTPVVGSGGSGTLSYSIAPTLPVGLSFNTSNGSISGTPAEIYSLQYHNVIVSDSSAQTASANFGLEIKQELTLTLSTSTIKLQLGQQLTSPLAPATATGGVGIRYFAISPLLPSGLFFSTSTGLISGTPSVIQTATTFTITVTDSAIYSPTPSIDSITFTLEVEALPLLLSVPNSHLVEIFGKPIDPFRPITVISGNAPYQWEISPPLPTGISFSNNGRLYGTPSESLGPRVTSTYHTITVTDLASQSKSETIKLKLSQDNVILSEDSNHIRDYLFEFIGTTSTGYGANLKGDAVQEGQIIQASNWDNLLFDTNRTLVHQNGTNTNIIPVANTGTRILAATPDRMYTAAQFLELNKRVVHPSQLVTMTVNTEKSINENWTCTDFVSTSSVLIGTASNGFVSSVRWSYEYRNQLYYFFNLGGVIKPRFTITGGRPQDIQAWEPLIAEINNIEFGRDQFLEALASDDLTWKYTLFGTGNTSTVILTTTTITDSYTNNAVVASFQVSDNNIFGSIGLYAGNQKKKTKKKKFFGNGEWIRVSLFLDTDYETTYVAGNNSGISSQKPQTQLITRYVSSWPSPLVEFSFGTGLASDSQVITLNNNSEFTCTVTDIVLGGYTDGVVTPRSMTIPPGANDSFAVQFFGSTPGYFKGTIDVLQNVNPLTIFTEVNVGSVSPPGLITTVTSTALISQDFVVDHRGGNYDKFEVVFPETNPAGFTYLGAVDNNEDTFRVVFDPTVYEVTGTYQTTATVVIYPLDSSLDLVNIEVPVSITTDIIYYQALGSWVSALGYNNSCLGLTYDIIGGTRYLTVGIGYGTSLDIADLQVEDLGTNWETVYRIPINKGTTSEMLYTKDYLVSDVDNIGEYFGIRNAAGSILTVRNYRGNLEIDLNALNKSATDADHQKVLEGLAGAFYYYDETLYRNSQLELSPNEINQTVFFNGFDVRGNTITDLVAANLA